MSKKVISLLLAVMLTVSMVAVAALSVSADTDDEGKYVPSEGTDTYRVYFYKPADWANEFTQTAGIYWWEATDSPTAWPGYVAQNSDITNIYYCDVPQDVSKLIWNNALDGTDDPTSPEYTKALQTTDIGFIGYDVDESDYYPQGGIDNFNNMIYVVDPELTEVNASGKTLYAGEWFYYYGNGEYGNVPNKADLVSGVSYYGKDGAFPTVYVAEGEETTVAPTTETVEPTTAEEVTTVPETTDAETTTDATQAPTEPESKLALTVNATSNYFPAASAQYDPTTKQITVTYNMQSSKNVLDTQWFMTYDPKVLSVADENTNESVCPAVNGKGSLVNFDFKDNGVGYIKFAASDLGLYDFSEKTPFAKVVFDVKDQSSDEPISTTVDLVVQVLRVSELAEGSQYTDGTKEVLLVDKQVAKTDPVAAAVKPALSTELTPSTYVVPTTAEPTTEEPTTVEPTTVEPTTVAPTTVEPTTAEPTEAPTTVEPTTAEPTEAPTTIEPSTAESTEETTQESTEESTEETTEASTAAETTSTQAPTSVTEPTSAESTETSTAVEPTTSQNPTSVTESATQNGNATSDTPDSPKNNNNSSNAVQTGEAPLAIVILSLLIGATCVMFVLRKREDIL